MNDGNIYKVFFEDLENVLEVAGVELPETDNEFVRLGSVLDAVEQLVGLRWDGKRGTWVNKPMGYLVRIVE